MLHAFVSVLQWVNNLHVVRKQVATRGLNLGLPVHIPSLDKNIGLCHPA